MTYESALSAWGVTADNEVAALKAEVQAKADEILRQQVELASQDIEIKKLNRRVHRLTDKLLDCQDGVVTPPDPIPDPTPTPLTTVFGSSCGYHSYEEFTRRAGARLKIQRSYEDNGLPSNWSQVKGSADNCSIVFSFKENLDVITGGGLDARLRGFLASIPQDQEARLIVWHEPENDSWTPAQFTNAQVRVRRFVDEANATRKLKIRFGGCLIAWTASTSYAKSSGLTVDNWVPPTGTWDFIAWDGYSWNGDREPNQIFDRNVAYCKVKGINFAVGETGTPVGAYNGRRADWIRRNQQYALDNNAEFFTYWDGKEGVSHLDTDEEFVVVVRGPGN